MNFLLQVFDLTKSPQPVITVNSAEDAEVGGQLEKLFDAIANAATRENLEFLKSLLPSEPKR